VLPKALPAGKAARKKPAPAEAVPEGKPAARKPAARKAAPKAQPESAPKLVARRKAKTAAVPAKAVA
jgi:hypothetical protein